MPEIVQGGHTGMEIEIASAQQEDSITTTEVHNEENLQLDIVSYVYFVFSNIINEF